MTTAIDPSISCPECGGALTWIGDGEMTLVGYSSPPQGTQVDALAGGYDVSDELPPIPEPGFYWARCSLDGGYAWQVVMVSVERDPFAQSDFRYVACLDHEGGCEVYEWGPRLEPPQ